MSTLSGSRPGEPAVDEPEAVGQDEGRRLLDDAARRHLNMSREEFLAAWDDGRLADLDGGALDKVAVLEPFGR